MDYAEDDIVIVLRYIETLYIRNCVVSGYVANKYEIEFSQIAFQISNDSSFSIELIIERIKKMIVSNEIFRSNFLNLTVSAKYGKILLRELNDRFEPEIQIRKDNIKIHLEHIMPKKLNEDWKIDEELHKNYLNRIGNLTLLGQEYNRKIQNFNFSKKKEKYTESKIQITNDLVSYDKWDIEDIEKRQEDLYVKALEIWSLDI